MKLLDKYEVQKAKAQDRKKEIDEGAKLARQVDALRVVTAKEQANLTKFRDESLKTLRLEITTLNEKKEALEKAVADLEERRKLLLRPLDKEKADLEASKKELETLNGLINQEKERLEQNKKDYSQRNEELKLEESRIEDIKAETGHKLVLANSLHEDSKRVLEEIEGKAINWGIEQGIRLSDLKRLEAELVYRNTDLLNQENQIKAEKEAIFSERLRLADQRATLDRAFKRLKNGNNNIT